MACERGPFQEGLPQKLTGLGVSIPCTCLLLALSKIPFLITSQSPPALIILLVAPAPGLGGGVGRAALQLAGAFCRFCSRPDHPLDLLSSLPEALTLICLILTPQQQILFNRRLSFFLTKKLGYNPHHIKFTILTLKGCAI